MFHLSNDCKISFSTRLFHGTFSVPVGQYNLSSVISEREGERARQISGSKGLPMSAEIPRRRRRVRNSSRTLRRLCARRVSQKRIFRRMSGCYRRNCLRCHGTGTNYSAIIPQTRRHLVPSLRSTPDTFADRVRNDRRVYTRAGVSCRLIPPVLLPISHSLSVARRPERKS